MKKEDLEFVDQLVKSVEESEVFLEKSFNEGDFNKFQEAKKLILKVNKQIEEIVKK